MIQARRLPPPTTGLHLTPVEWLEAGLREFSTIPAIGTTDMISEYIRHDNNDISKINV